MMRYIYFLWLSLLFMHCAAQNAEKPLSPVGGPCEGCEAIFEYGDKELSNIDTLPNFLDTDPKLRISGIVYHPDGKTPAEGVIIYAYHTNREGIYETLGNETGWGRRHGIFRGWVKTGVDGAYTFYTFRPASYPNRREPEHIHLTIKEPELNEYYIENIMFTDDPLLTPEKISSLRGRGGSGIVTPERVESLWEVRRDIFLGKNIPNYE